MQTLFASILISERSVDRTNLLVSSKFLLIKSKLSNGYDLYTKNELGREKSLAEPKQDLSPEAFHSMLSPRLSLRPDTSRCKDREGRSSDGCPS